MYLFPLIKTLTPFPKYTPEDCKLKLPRFLFKVGDVIDVLDVLELEDEDFESRSDSESEE